MRKLKKHYDKVRKMQEKRDKYLTILEDGTKIWKSLDGKYHQEDGPAIEEASGDKYWFINGSLHRLDGPASEFADGSKEWFINNQQIPVKSQEEFERYLKLKAFW